MEGPGEAWLLLLLAAAVGYSIGSISPAAVLARLRGVDLRGSGSGNPGATNAARTMGVGIGVVVGLLDVAKGYLPTVVFAGLEPSAGLAAGVAAVLGHVTSPFLRGRGGRGVATSLGAVLAVQPLWALLALVVFGVAVALTRWVALGSMLAAVTLVLVAVAARGSWPELVFVVALAAIVEVRHLPHLLTRLRHPLR